MVNFLKKLFFFASPLFLLFALLTYVLVHFSELSTIDDLIALHASGEPYLFGKRYVPFSSDPKHELLKAVGPEITTFGNSRVLQIRKSFFSTTSSFYNYGQINSIAKLVPTLKDLDETGIRHPKLIIVQLEQSYFIGNPSADEGNVADDGVGKPNWLLIYSTIFKDIMRKKIELSALLSKSEKNLIGVDAGIFHAGYREDGSRKYPDTILDYTNPKHEDYLFEDSKRRIRENINLFSQASSYNQSTFKEFALFLELANQQGNHVTLFFPPYAPSVYRVMMEGPYDFGYQKKLAADIRAESEKYGFTFIDFSDPSTLGLHDTDFFDGYHPKEPVLKHVLDTLAEQDAVLRAYLK